jgi:hypothetical protein
LKRIVVELAKPGQILAEKVARHDGVLLANAGSEVTEGLLRMLVKLSIDTIVIEEDERRTEEEIQAEYLAAVARLDRAFRRVDGQPVLMALKKTIMFLSKEEMEKAIFALRESQEKATEAAPGGPGPADAAAPEVAGVEAKAEARAEARAEAKVKAKDEAKAEARDGAKKGKKPKK